MKRVEGHIVELHDREIFEGSVVIDNGVIVAIERHPTTSKRFIMPGFVDAHVHIESSMLTPRNFGDMVVRYGTIGVVTDPHEIANVMGVEGIEKMVESAKSSPIKCFFTIPSCVPATPFDSAGGVISVDDVERMADSGSFVALSEMMNVPGVLYGDSDVMAKIDIAKRHNLPIDGHAPALSGDNLVTYISSGISTDHETFDLEEAREKISRGMKILIREGSAARNYDSLSPLIAQYPDMLMFCTDDSHPDDIIEQGHIDRFVRRSVAQGYDLFDVLRIASLNPVEHYSLDMGLLRVGDRADFIVVDDLENFNVCDVYINGEKWSGQLEEDLSLDRKSVV